MPNDKNRRFALPYHPPRGAPHHDVGHPARPVGTHDEQIEAAGFDLMQDLIRGISDLDENRFDGKGEIGLSSHRLAPISLAISCLDPSGTSSITWRMVTAAP
jgi:hypothetical protein